MILPSEDRTFPKLEDLLSRASKRQQALSANIANLDTPGYKAKDYSFQDALASIGMKRTSERHFGTVQDTTNARVIEVETADKPNGNNVDLERELTEITKNGMEYVTLVEYLTQKIRTLRSAITEGGKV